MSSRTFLQSLQQKLKGGNSKAIHLNALPGRLATRLDLKNLETIRIDLPDEFLHTLLTKPGFEFRISFDDIDLHKLDKDEQQQLGLLSKRLNAILIENEDFYKEHGMKTLGFGYPILIRRSSKDPAKVIKAPLFIWPLDAVKSREKPNEWRLYRNKTRLDSGKLVDADLHAVSVNEVLHSFIRSEDGISLPNLPESILEDGLISSAELLEACASILEALNPVTRNSQADTLTNSFTQPVNTLPDATRADTMAANGTFIHFGGVFGLFRAQKEPIIADISRLLDRMDEFRFDALPAENLSVTPFSAVDTDPSQQAIISALGTHANQIIQGPPGTGKSQSLTALITNALANNLKCLVVCEKKTALDVIRQNLVRRHEKLGALVAVIDDVSEDRETIIDAVRERQQENPWSLTTAQASMQYDSAMRAIAESAGAVNVQHQALGLPLYRGLSWGHLVGRCLALQRHFGELPYREVLSASDFRLTGDEQELEELKIALDRSEALHGRSHALQESFGNLADRLFTGSTPGEVRLKAEAFGKTADQTIPQTETAIQEELKWIQDWMVQQYASVPAILQEATAPWLSWFQQGVSATDPLPEQLPLERRIGQTMAELETLLAKAEEFMQDYRAQLERHYGSYGQAVSSSIDGYLGFAGENVGEFGPVFLKNGPVARFRTAVLSLLSGRQQKIRDNRLAVRSNISQVRQVQQTKPYIQHQYNDDQEAGNLRVYISNIEELQNKTNSWIRSYPSDIDNWLKEVRDRHFHPDLLALQSKADMVREEYRELSGRLHTEFRLSADYFTEDIPDMIRKIPVALAALRQLKETGEAIHSAFKKRAGANEAINQIFGTLETTDGGASIFREPPYAYSSLPEALEACAALRQWLASFRRDLPELRAWYDWQQYQLQLPEFYRQVVHTVSQQPVQEWARAFEYWYLFSLLTLHEPAGLPRDEYELQRYKQHKARFNDAQLNMIIARWSERQRQSLQEFRDRGLVVNSLFNKKGSKGMRRNSLRTIIQKEFGLFTDLFPVLLVNPSVCSSLLPLQEGLFDLVIFDEASQLRLEDTYAALIRGKARIVSGDKHQMAPSSWFESGGAVLDPDEEEPEADEPDPGDRQLQDASFRNLADSESLLAYAEDRGFLRQHLDIHYRSRHPYLIDFSNYAFYGSRLMPVPARLNYKPIQFIPVDGIYEGQVNREEALKVVDLLRHHIKPYANGTYPSVGVATFNIYQRNLIWEEIDRQRQTDPLFEQVMTGLGSSFFVKNLENIQGDERDVIILSTTFGRKSNGSFSQAFGPIIQGKGHRMLNVIITRAKYKIFVCSSFPLESVRQYPELLRQQQNRGRAVLYAWLMYARAVSDGNEELRQSILLDLAQHCSEKGAAGDRITGDAGRPGFGGAGQTELPGAGREAGSFEGEVYERLAKSIGPDRILRSYRLGGFLIDMVICSEHSGKPIIALECDGNKNHQSPEAYAWDLFRQEQLELHGLRFLRIWSTRWWDAPDRELEKLLEYIREKDQPQQSALRSA